MKADILWDKFAETGSIADYLSYSAFSADKDKKDDNNRRDCAEGASVGRT